MKHLSYLCRIINKTNNHKKPAATGNSGKKDMKTLSELKSVQKFGKIGKSEEVNASIFDADKVSSIAIILLEKLGYKKTKKGNWCKFDLSDIYDQVHAAASSDKNICKCFISGYLGFIAKDKVTSLLEQDNLEMISKCIDF